MQAAALIPSRRERARRFLSGLSQITLANALLTLLVSQRPPLWYFLAVAGAGGMKRSGERAIYQIEKLGR